MPTISPVDAYDKSCPFNGFKPCLGNGCMAWIWVGPHQERVRTTNLAETPEGPRPNELIAPPKPAGDGWKPDGDPRYVGYENSAKLKLPKALEQWWTREIRPQYGRCGRIGPDDHYGHPF